MILNGHSSGNTMIRHEGFSIGRMPVKVSGSHLLLAMSGLHGATEGCEWRITSRQKLAYNLLEVYHDTVNFQTPNC